MINRPKSIKFIDYQFPSESIKKAFFRRIHDFPEATIKLVLNSFLQISPILQSDYLSLKGLLSQIREGKSKDIRGYLSSPYVRRLLLYIKTKGRIPVRDSITWVLDILDENPKLALRALEAYFLANAYSLPDGRIMGLSDSMAVIRARYFFLQHPINILLSLDPYQFEYLIDELFHDMGYKTILTKKTYDGGRDIIAEKRGAGLRQRNLVQCRRIRKNVGVEMLRSLLGVVSNEKATKGIMVTTSGFTPAAIRFHKQNPRLDAIDHRALHTLLNKHYGVHWPLKMDMLIGNSIKRHRALETKASNPK